MEKGEKRKWERRGRGGDRILVGGRILSLPIAQQRHWVELRSRVKGALRSRTYDDEERYAAWTTALQIKQ